uniref:FERM, ARH/RhoGEF and pleckstrin domain protein 2 n=1 Tax=Naja naja TaxID=35670 RepID=A0A8C6XT70_NAJNA
MGEIEGTYRVLQTPGSRLGVQKNSGVSTLEPGQNISSVMVSTSPRTYERSIQIKVKLLDNTQEVLDIESKCCGQKLLTEIFSRLNLVESDYFGIEFQNLQSYWIWLEPMKPIVKQVRRPKNTVLRLAVKFFPPDPENGKLCYKNSKQKIFLVSHLLQSEIGDFDESGDHEHLKNNQYFPNQERLQEKILAFHRKHVGETPAESDFQVLEIGRKLEMYGMRFHLASDREGTKINLAVSNMGVLVFQGNIKINTFNWSKIRKISFKRKRFLIKLHPEVHGPYQDTLEFLLGGRDECKNLWKICVEYHTFFRLSDQPKPKPKPVFFSRGSSFRYSGRTQKQLVDYVRESGLKKIPYESAVSLSPPLQETVIQGSSPLLSPVLSDVSGARFEEEDEMKHKVNKAYFIAKEILATERTYLKDLEVLTLWFRSAVVKENAMPEGLMTLFFSNIDPIYEFHRGFLKELEQRLALWEGRSSSGKGDYQRIGDVMLRNVQILKEFTNYLQKHDEVLMELEKATKRIKKLEIVYKEFELQRVCYLPLNTFLLKPIHRIIYYKLILGRLCKHYPADHRDYTDCKNALKEIADMTSQLQNSLIRLENFQKLIELQHDLLGTDNLIAPGREFIREGCLYKLTKKGLQQRMFFLFSDTLLYTSKGVTGTNQFKIRGHLPLHGMLVEESENEWSVPHCFTIYSAQKTVVVAASTRLEMEKWLEDLNMAIEMAKKTVEKSEAALRMKKLVTQKPAVHNECYTFTVNQLSGYLLRKFKNSNGWQKLWVVFTNFCLFFYKTHQDDYPLASLPLIGYTINMPTEEDGIQKDYVFKLQFKSHVYFFRAESKYTFESWSLAPF